MLYIYKIEQKSITQKLIDEHKKELKEIKSILCKQFLEGKLSILYELQKNGIECNKNMLRNY